MEDGRLVIVQRTEIGTWRIITALRAVKGSATRRMPDKSMPSDV